MSDKEFDKLMNEYVQSKANKPDKDLNKLAIKNTETSSENSSDMQKSYQRHIGMPKYAVALIVALCVVVLVFAVAFPVAFINSKQNNNEESKQTINRVWTAEMAYEIAVKGGYTGTYEEFLKVFSYINTVKMDEEGNLTLIFADGTEISAGKVEGDFNKGITSIAVGENGDLIISYSDGTTQTLPSSLFKGEQGVGIQDMYIDENGYMIVILTDGSKINAGLVNSKEKYTLELDPQGGYLETDYGGIDYIETSYIYEKDQYVQLPELKKTLYKFEGWYMIVDGQEIYVGDGITMVGDIKLVAKWSGGPENIYTKYEIPEEYHGTYISAASDNTIVQIKKDVIEAHNIEGGVAYYYPIIVDGKTRIYMEGIYADWEIYIKYEKDKVTLTFQDQVIIYLRAN